MYVLWNELTNCTRLALVTGLLLWENDRSGSLLTRLLFAKVNLFLTTMLRSLGISRWLKSSLDWSSQDVKEMT